MGKEFAEDNSREDRRLSRTPTWKAWIPAAVWLGIIALESSNLGSSDNTSRILYPLLHFLTGMNPDRFEVWHHIIRKTGHFVGYAILSWLLFRAWRATLPSLNAAWSMRWARTAFLMTALVATLDEWHQSFNPARTGRWQDVVLDSSAGLTMQVLIWLLLRKREQRLSS